MNGYRPQPMDTSAVALPEDLLDLTEQLAENVHENWAKARLEEGWVYGPVRDDAQKTTPCLVPYAELPKEERAYKVIHVSHFSFMMTVVCQFRIRKIFSNYSYSSKKKILGN